MPRNLPGGPCLDNPPISMPASPLEAVPSASWIAPAPVFYHCYISTTLKNYNHPEFADVKNYRNRC